MYEDGKVLAVIGNNGKAYKSMIELPLEGVNYYYCYFWFLSLVSGFCFCEGAVYEGAVYEGAEYDVH